MVILGYDSVCFCDCVCDFVCGHEHVWPWLCGTVPQAVTTCDCDLSGYGRVACSRL